MYQLGKKKIIFVFLSVVLLLVFLAACNDNSNDVQGSNDNSDSSDNINGNENTDEVFELVINNSNPSTHHWAYNVYEPWAELVEEKTEGRVEVTLYHGGTLGEVSTALQDIRGGVYDVGFLSASLFYEELFPLTIGNLPFAFPDSITTTDVMHEIALEYEEELFDGVIYMGMSSTDPFIFYSNKPIKSVEDVKGKSFRVAGRGEVLLTELWGGTPVSIPPADIYTSIDRSTIDGAIYSPIGGYGIKIHEVAPYLTTLPISTSPAMPIMSKEFFDKIPEDLQQLFKEELNPKLAELFVDSYTNELTKAYEETESAIEGKGEIIELSENEFNEFKKYSEDRWNEWIEDANERGYDGEKMMNDFKQKLEDAGLDLPF